MKSIPTVSYYQEHMGAKYKNTNTVSGTWYSANCVWKIVSLSALGWSEFSLEQHFMSF